MNAAKVVVGTKEEQALADALAKKKAAMSEAEIAKLVEDTKALKAYQSRVETPEELACIPMLSREDIGKEPLPVPYTVEKTEAGIPLAPFDSKFSVDAAMSMAHCWKCFSSL